MYNKLKIVLLVCCAWALQPFAQHTFINKYPVVRYFFGDVLETSKGNIIAVNNGFQTLNLLPTGKLSCVNDYFYSCFNLKEQKDSNKILISTPGDNWGTLGFSFVDLKGKRKSEYYKLWNPKDSFGTSTDVYDDKERKQYVISGIYYHYLRDKFGLPYMAVVDYTGKVKWEKVFKDTAYHCTKALFIQPNKTTKGYTMVINNTYDCGSYTRYILNVDSVGNEIKRTRVLQNFPVGKVWQDYRIDGFLALENGTFAAVVNGPDNNQLYIYDKNGICLDKQETEYTLIPATVFNEGFVVGRGSRILTLNSNFEIINISDLSIYGIYDIRLAKRSRDGGFYGVSVADTNNNVLDDNYLIFKCDKNGNIQTPSNKEMLQGFSLAPNPAKDILNIKSFYYTGTIKCSIYNVVGALALQSTQADTQAIDISLLSSGVYFVKINLPDEKVSKTLKLVVE